MPYTDWLTPHAGSAEVLFTGMFDEPAGTVAKTLYRSDVTQVTIAPTTGQVMVHALPLPQGLVVSNLAVNTGSTAAVAPTHFWLGVTDANLRVLAVTADQGSAAISAGTFYKFPVTISYVIPQTGLYYAVCSASATTTMPTFAGGGSVATGVGGQAPVHTGTAGTQAAPPALGAQLNSGTVSASGAVNFAFWVS